MGVLDRFERRLDQLVNGAFARAFKAEVQPVEIASAYSASATTGPRSLAGVAPSCPTHFASIWASTTTSGSTVYREPLSKELADLVKEHAGEQGYAIVGPLTVDLQLSDDLETGMFRVSSHAEQGPTTGSPRSQRPIWRVGSRIVAITQDVNVIGRGSEADIQIDDPGVPAATPRCGCSRRPMVTDLGSTNGTVVDGAAVDRGRAPRRF